MTQGGDKMKIGCCASLDQAVMLQEAGFDFLEVPVVSLMGENQQQVNERIKAYQDSPLPVEVCNILLPGSLKVTGNQVDQQALDTYLAKMLPRVKEIGADTVVFGSGGARTYPTDFSAGEAHRQIVHFLQMVAWYAESLELTMVIEPLNREESNAINTVLEATALAEEVNHPSIKVLADFYHMQKEQEPLTNIAKADRWIRHIHVADSNRFAPGTGSYPYHDLREQLESIDYHQRLSIECQWKDMEAEAAEANRFLHEIF